MIAAHRNGLFGALLGLLAMVPLAMGQVEARYPARPPQATPIHDGASLIEASDESAIVAQAAALLADEGIPIVVATITSMADQGAPGWTIERYAHNLFDEWGIGSPERNQGVLLLVSKNDRKVRIELGADWGRSQDAACMGIVNETLIPAFKKGEFSTGIRGAVERLDAIARSATHGGRPETSAGAESAPLPARPAAPPQPRPSAMSNRNLQSLLPACGGVPVLLVVILVVLSVFKGRGGSSYGGWSSGALGGRRGWGGGGMGGFLTGMMAGSMLSSSRSRGTRSSGIFSSGSGSARSFGGGGRSFGGGFSGRGGASGSW